ncbi:MAG: PIN domain-containing protein [Acidimicrobiales bacterium]
MTVPTRGAELSPGHQRAEAAGERGCAPGGEPLAAAEEIGRASICDLEVGYSARNADEWDRLVGALDTFGRAETSSTHVRRALQVQRLLAGRSLRGRKIPDLLVAAAAEALGVEVLHYDSDFDLIAAATGQRCSWVVPAGSID